MYNENFKGKLFGFDRQEVSSYIRKARSDHEKEMEKKEKEIVDLRRKNKLSEEKVNELQAKIEEIYDQKAKVADVLLKVQEKADLLEEETVKKCEEKKSELDNQISQKVEELDKIKKDIGALKEDVVVVLDRYRTQLENVVESL
jgi:chromosome segregation ATPase